MTYARVRPVCLPCLTWDLTGTGRRPVSIVVARRERHNELTRCSANSHPAGIAHQSRRDRRLQKPYRQLESRFRSKQVETFSAPETRFMTRKLPLTVVADLRALAASQRYVRFR